MVSTPKIDDPWCAIEVANNCIWLVACWNAGTGIASQKKNNGKNNNRAAPQPHKYNAPPHSKIGNAPMTTRGCIVQYPATYNKPPNTMTANPQ